MRLEASEPQRRLEPFNRSAVLRVRQRRSYHVPSQLFCSLILVDVANETRRPSVAPATEHPALILKHHLSLEVSDVSPP